MSINKNTFSYSKQDFPLQNQTSDISLQYRNWQFKCRSQNVYQQRVCCTLFSPQKYPLPLLQVQTHSLKRLREKSKAVKQSKTPCIYRKKAHDHAEQRLKKI